MDNLNLSDLDKKAIDISRVLAAEAVENAGSGHPGTAISLAPVAYLLYQKIMRLNPADPNWLGRDYFILSCGHSSLTQYIQLFLAGYGLEIDDLKALRRFGSLTPGHPERGHTNGVEFTTGPLGQGLASAAGIAASCRREKYLLDPDANEQNKSIFDRFVYVICSDGDIQEGVTSEAASWAGTQKLNNLIVIYDDNNISIEDKTDIALSEDVAGRYKSYGWNVQIVDWKSGDYKEDLNELYKAIKKAQISDQPTIIILKTIIGWPSPGLQNTGKIHGSPMGKDEIDKLKEILNLDSLAPFEIDKSILEYTRDMSKWQKDIDNWNNGFEIWKQKNPDKYKLLLRLKNKDLPENLEEYIDEFNIGDSVATRKASGVVLNKIASLMDEFWGGSADLAESNLTTLKNCASFGPPNISTPSWRADYSGRVLHFGIREHAQAAILNGINIGLTRAFGGTFFVFSDYQRPAIRLAALSKIPSIFVWTHDSIGLGADGPTHQPVEHLNSLRLMPNIDIYRPCDANETIYAYIAALKNKDRPTGIVLSRQNLPVITTKSQAKSCLKGAYILEDNINPKTGIADILLLGTGSEVALITEASQILKNENIYARLVSCPCLEAFLRQGEKYKNSVIDPQIKARISVEAGTGALLSNLLGSDSQQISLENFGLSANEKDLFKYFGFTPENIVAKAKELLQK